MYETTVTCPVCGAVFDIISHEEPKPHAQAVAMLAQPERLNHGDKSPECMAHKDWIKGWNTITIEVMDRSKIEACLCGAKNSQVVSEYRPGRCTCYCNSCDKNEAFGATRSEAISIWNTMHKKNSNKLSWRNNEWTPMHKENRNKENGDG